MIQTDPNFIHRLPTKFLPQNDRTVESTLARSSEPVNAGGLPDPAGHPHTLNQPQMFLTIDFNRPILLVYTEPAFSRGA